MPHRGLQHSRERVIGQGEISFPLHRSNVLQFPDQPPRVVQAHPQFLPVGDTFVADLTGLLDLGS